MTLHEQVTDILASAVEAQECAGISVLVRRCGEEMLYTQAGMSDVASGRLIHRDSIFRLYSQSKPITAAAVMLLAERGQIDLMDGVDRYLPGFRNARVVDKQGTIRPATRAPWLMELLGMTAGVCYRQRPSGAVRRKGVRRSDAGNPRGRRRADSGVLQPLGAAAAFLPAGHALALLHLRGHPRRGGGGRQRNALRRVPPQGVL